MNDTIRAFAQQALKDGLAQCTEGQQGMFKRMYSGIRDRGPEYLAQINAADITEVIDNMPDENLNRAMEQVEATLAKAAKTDVV